MGSLFSKIIAFPNLLLAAKRAARGKRYRSNVAAFTLALEEELHGLQQELMSHSYRPGRYRTFVIRDKKPRLISAAPFRDRVVHHALCNMIEPIFDRGFLDDSYACRKGKGTHTAINRASGFASRFRFVLKCDIQQYFSSIDHGVLMELIRRRIWDKEVLWLVNTIIEASHSHQEFTSYFPGDDLFTPFERRKGLPIGNQTSQFFANVYLNGLDHYIKEVLQAPAYIRYVDDLLVFHHRKEPLHHICEAIRTYGENLRLRLHPGKCYVAPVRTGFTFLGHRIFPSHRRLEAGNVRRFKRRLRWYRKEIQEGRLTVEKAHTCIQSWVAHAAQANTVRLREQIFGDRLSAFSQCAKSGVGQKR